MKVSRGIIVVLPMLTDLGLVLGRLVCRLSDTFGELERPGESQKPRICGHTR